MDDKFKIEIISPEKIIFSGDGTLVKFPSYEGDMSVLKNHISIITFFRPGIIHVEKEDNKIEEFFVQDGTIEFLNNNLIILSATAINLKNISKEFLDNLNQDTKERLEKDDITDHDRYVLNHKLDSLKEIRI